MRHTHCDYSGDRDEALVAHLYDEIDPAARALFDAHLTTCAACRDELSGLAGVRARLGRWLPPERQAAVASRSSPAASHQPPAARRVWWREMPPWAQAAAALLFLGVAAGFANFDVHYDNSGLSVRTGWSTRADNAAPTPARGPEAAAAWRPDIAALEQRLRAEIGRSNDSATTRASAATRPDRPTAPLDAETLERVRSLIGESERRQQRDLALRVAAIMRDVNAQRQADLVKIDRSLGLIQNNTGIEVLKQRELLNYVLRTSQRQR